MIDYVPKPSQGVKVHLVPSGLRYRLSAIALGAIMNIALGVLYGVLNVVLNPQDVSIVQKLNSFGFGLGFAVYLAPLGALGGWICAEIALPLVRRILAKEASNKRLKSTFVVTGVALAVSIGMFFIIGGLTAFYYPFLALVVFVTAWLSFPWLNQSAPTHKKPSC